MREVSNVVNGAVGAGRGEVLDLVNPSTGEVFGQAPVSVVADVDAAVAAARGSGPATAITSGLPRRYILR